MFTPLYRGHFLYPFSPQEDCRSLHPPPEDMGDVYLFAAILTHTVTHAVCPFVSVLQAVQQSICCYLSVSLSPPPSPPPSSPPPCPIQSPSQLPGFVLSPSVPPPHPPSDQSLPCFLIQHGSAPPPPSLVDSAICPRGSWDFQTRSKYTAENSHHDEPFNLVANQTCFCK